MLELHRILYREHPRDWKQRWLLAGSAIKWEEAEKESFKAEASSPIWGVLANDFKDSTGNEKPPFFYGSGMGVRNEKGEDIYEGRDEDESELSIIDLLFPQSEMLPSKFWKMKLK